MSKLLFLQSLALVIGFLIDFFVGDPHGLPHPVVGMGKLVSLCEKHLLRGTRGDLRRGAVTVAVVAGLSTAVPAGLLYLAWRLHPAVYLLLESVMCFQLVAARDLVRESRAVESALEAGDVEGARRAVSMGDRPPLLDGAFRCRGGILLQGREYDGLHDRVQE